MKFALDHLSLEVSHVRNYKGFIEDDLGFNLTLTPQDPDHHGSIELDRWYIEISSSDEISADQDMFPNGSFFFLRVDNFDALLQERETRQLPLKAPQEYISKGGWVWYDVEFDISGFDHPLPMITQPIYPEKDVKAFPFPLKKTHPNRLQTISAQYLMTDRYDDLIQIFSNLLEQPKPAWQENRLFGTEQVSLNFSNGALIICKPSQIVSKHTFLGLDKEGVFAVELRSGNLQQTHQFFVESKFEIMNDESGTHWLKPNADLNFFLGYK